MIVTVRRKVIFHLVWREELGAIEVPDDLRQQEFVYLGHRFRVHSGAADGSYAPVWILGRQFVQPANRSKSQG